MNAPKKRRFRFGLRTLLGVVALVGVGLYFRPGQVAPENIPNGATKLWVKWYVGTPDDTWSFFHSRAWYYHRPSGEVGYVFFDNKGGRVQESGTARIHPPNP